MRTIISVVIGVLFLTVIAPRIVRSETVAEQIAELKNPNLSDTDKWNLSRQIQSQGTAAIPALIACAKDPSPVGILPLEGGECINRPAHLPTPPQCINPVRTETLGERCERMLYNIVTPSYTSPYMTMLTAKQAPPPPFVIEDWNRWWAQQKHHTLEQIHQEARKKIDAFWLNNHRGSIVWK